MLNESVLSNWHLLQYTWKYVVCECFFWGVGGRAEIGSPHAIVSAWCGGKEQILASHMEISHKTI